MSELEKIVEESGALPESEEAKTQQPIPLSASGLTIQPINVEAALSALDSLSAGDPEEQRETFEYLKRALNEDRAAGGERLLFPDEVEASVASSDSESQPPKPSAYGAPLPPFDPEGAIAVLQSFFEGDLEEQRETLEYLKRALNEDRAAVGARLLFSDE